MDGNVTCSICLNILFRPVTLPCDHEFCLECISLAVDYTAYQCPICRYRLSNWLRKVKDLESSVCEKREGELRNLFPDYYKNRELGLGPTLTSYEERLLKNLTIGNQVCDTMPTSAGDIHEEYSRELAKTNRLREAENKENEVASLALAYQLISEDSFEFSASVPVTDCARDSRTVNPFRRFDPKVSIGSKVIRSPSLFKNKVKKTVVTNLKRTKASKSRTLLEYAVDRRTVQDGAQVVDGNITVQGGAHVAYDSEFAHKLQAKYARCVHITRSITCRKLRSGKSN